MIIISPGIPVKLPDGGKGGRGGLFSSQSISHKTFIIVNVVANILFTFLHISKVIKVVVHIGNGANLVDSKQNTLNVFFTCLLA